MDVISVIFGPSDASDGSCVAALELLGHRIHEWRRPPASLAGRRDHDVIVVEGVHNPEAARRYCEELATQPEQAPVLLVVAQQSLNGLRADWGFTEFVLESCSVGELQARLLRLKAAHGRDLAPPLRRYGPLVLDSEHLTLAAGDQSTRLTPVEHAILALFFDKPQAVLSREVIRHEAWTDHESFSSRNIDTFVCRIRRKLGRNGHYIQTIRSVGYRFTMPAGESDEDQQLTPERSAA